MDRKSTRRNSCKKIFDLAEIRKIDGYITRGGILFKEVDDDLRIVISLRPQVIQQIHKRGYFSVAKAEALLNKEY